MAISSSTSQASEMRNRTGGEDGEDELPEHDPLATRFLPELPGEAKHFLNLVQLERRRGGNVQGPALVPGLAPHPQRALAYSTRSPCGGIPGSTTERLDAVLYALSSTVFVYAE